MNQEDQGLMASRVSDDGRVKSSGGGSGKLDTSGCIWLPHGQLANTYWEDLDPFTQGYIEALLGPPYLYIEKLPEFEARPLRFSDLAIETLAQIMADCGRPSDRVPNTADAGRRYWRDRLAGRYAAYPPLTIYPGADGKVRLVKTLPPPPRDPPAASDKSREGQ